MAPELTPDERRERRDHHRRRGRRRRLLAGGAAAAAGAGIALALVLGRGSGPSPPSTEAATTAPATTAATGPPRVARAPLAVRERRALAAVLRSGRPLFCGGGRRRLVALTFDDGPGGYTELALRVLRQAHARATFFLVGRNLATWPRAPREEAAIGALGDHTWTHADLLFLPTAQVDSQLADTRSAIRAVSGLTVGLFRPPYGAHDARVDAAARALGLVQVLWSIDSRDSEGADWNGIADTVERNLRPGAIVLMHENRGQTIRALKFRLLPYLRRHGYRTVSVPELLALDPPTARQLRDRTCPGGQTPPKEIRGG